MSAYDPTKAAEEAAQQVQQKREAREASDRALEEFFARGGQVQKIANNVSGRVEGSSYSAWGKPKKKAATPDEEPAAVLEIEDEDTAALDSELDDPEELA